MDAYANLRRLGLSLPPPPPRGGLYTPAMPFGSGMLYLSGAGPTRDGTPVYTGKAGGTVDMETAQEAARLCVLNLLAMAEAELSDLNRVRRLVKMLGFVASANDFTRQPEVMNAASSLLTEVFAPDMLPPARSAIGVNVLPGDIPVEIELLLEYELTYE